MTDLEKDKILLLAHSIGKMAKELQSIKRLLKEIADASQMERIKTLDYCDICNHKGCDNCIANSLDDYCVPSGYAPKDTPQTDCDTCRRYKLACELFSEVCKYEPTTQTETQNSNLTFEKDECAKEYEELGLKELKELINADRKTENCSEKPNNCEDEPQYDFGEYADRLWKIAYERGKREALEQTEPSCDTCKLKDTTEWCKRQEVCRAYTPKDELQTTSTPYKVDTSSICKIEPQTDCPWK